MSELAKKLIAENIAKHKQGEDASSLDLGNCGLTDLAKQVPELFDLVWLEELTLSNEWWDEEKGESQISPNKGAKNELSEIPKAFTNLSALRIIRMGKFIGHNGNISDVSFLDNLTRVTFLDLSYNQIIDVSILKKFTTITFLDLSSNQISDISFLGKLTGLTSLNLSHNQISDINFLEKLTKLTSLDLSCNQINDISFLEKLTRLTSLNLSCNQINDISFLEKLTRLTSLNLSCNQINDISFLEKLTKLTSLYLSENQINDISFLQKLTRLATLDLSENQISGIRPLKHVIRNLSDLFTNHNPIKYVPKEVYEQLECATDLRAYWQSLDEGQATTNQQLKVMFLGNGCVGKTTLLHWFLDGVFRELSLEEGRTHGIILQPYQFPDSEVMAHFWDFGGQEVYHATHRLFLGRRTLYLLVWASETPEKEEELRHPPQYWLDMIADVADKNERSRVLIIQNRFDMQPERNILDDEQRSAYEERGLDMQTFSIDAKGGKGVRPLLATIQEAAEELVDTHQEQLPQSWVEIRTAVAKRKAAREKTLPMDDFARICQEAGEENNTQTILGYLHRAGELFHFPDRFEGQIILDQQWAVKAVYAVLKRERIERYGGKFLVSDLIGFWREDDPMLSVEDARTFLQFILDNKTAFYAKRKERGDDPELIVPQLLTEEAPSIIHSLEDIPDRLQHRIFYNFLHRDIISRFIVRTAYLSEQQEYWRQGIHIRRGQAKAAVFVENDADGQPRLSVVCYGQGKEDLLQGIREELDNIRPLTKAQEYCFEKGAWRPYSSSLLEGPGGKSGLAAPSLTQEVVDLQAFFQPLKVFFSYSKHDRNDYLDPLLNYLSPLARGGWLIPWEDSQIIPGEEWDERIKSEIESSDVILLLVSDRSLNTDYIWNVEIEAAVQRQKEGTAWVVPVILSNCLWQKKKPNGEYIFPPAKLGALPTKGTPVSEWERREDAWHDIANGIMQICEKRKG